MSNAASPLVVASKLHLVVFLYRAPMQNFPYDLFGEVAITDTDLRSWVAAIAPRWLSPPRSYLLYVRDWNVADKVRRSKIAGTFDALTQKKPDSYHARLSLDVIS
jgi:hypothetical protein